MRIIFVLAALLVLAGCETYAVGGTVPADRVRVHVGVSTQQYYDYYDYYRYRRPVVVHRHVHQPPVVVVHKHKYKKRHYRHDHRYDRRDHRRDHRRDRRDRRRHD